MWKMTIAFTALSGSRFWSRHVLHSEPKLENTNCTETISTAVTRHKQQTLGRLRTWIIERLDRKLADAIGSNIVEKCDVTLLRAIQPHSTFCASYVSSHISLSLSSTIHIGHVLK